ncbi:hypothetical protein B0H13DRAFT_1911313 [Mycena leptocephala]|nr:hypothetical protein B0H13DRAFT_1911313 [Mycena leptocephala]
MVDEVALYSKDVWLPESTTSSGLERAREVSPTSAPVAVTAPPVEPAPTAPEHGVLEMPNEGMDDVQMTWPGPDVWSSDTPHGGTLPPSAENELLPTAEVEIATVAMESIESGPKSLEAAPAAPPIAPTPEPARPPPVAPRAMRGLPLAGRLPLAEHFSDPPSQPLLRRLSGVVVPLEERLSTPHMPLSQRLSDRAPASLVDRIHARNDAAGPSDLCLQRRYPLAVPSPTNTEDGTEEGGPKRKKKVRARALQSEAEASSSAPEIPPVSGLTALELTPTLALLTADEIEAEVEEGELVAPVDEDEEMLDPRWSNEDDEDRPVAG